MKKPWYRRFTMIHKLMLLGTSIGILVLAYFYYAIYIYVKFGPIVQINQGKLQGRILESRNGTEYLAFLGIPYAKPPIKNLRFQTPQDPDSWDDVRDATFYRSKCTQLEIFITGFVFGSEDCLYLDIHTPKIKDNTTEKLLPVMVYIHGGLFQVGGSDRIGGAYFMDEKVVLVSINYRLGVFGFLNTGDATVRGNMGLKDQSKALKWIKYNIETFGGDPNRVTIFGESAGGASVNLQMLSPMSKGLFISAISQSGTSLSDWVILRTPKKQAKRFAKKFDCPTENSQELVDCLRLIDEYDLVNANSELQDVLYYQKLHAFVPTIETINDEQAFLTEEPTVLLKSGRFNRVPWITGVNADEGVMFSSIMVANQTKMDEAKDNWNEWAPTVLNFDRNDTVSEKIREFYFGNDTEINKVEKQEIFTDVIGDRIFKVDASNAADLARKHVPTYIYLNSYHGQFSMAEIMPQSQGGIHLFINVAWYGFKRIFREFILREDFTQSTVGHADELFLLFPMQFLPRYAWVGQADYEMSADFVKLWVSFATDSNNLELRGVRWPSINSTQEYQQFLNISLTPDVIDHPFIDTVKFWNSLNLPLR